MPEQINKNNRILPDIIVIKTSDKDGTITALNTDRTNDSQESSGIIKCLVCIAKNLLESFRSRTSRFSSENDINQMVEEHHPSDQVVEDVSPFDKTSHAKSNDAVNVVPASFENSKRKTETLQIKSIFRKTSESVAKIAKSNSPLCSEFYAKNINSNSSYKFICRNMNKELAEAVGVSYRSESESDNIKHEPWTQPEKHGLENSPRIIPDYYMGTNMKNKVLTIDYQYMILDDIRNLRPLNKAQLEYIDNELSETQKQEIIVELNSVIKMFCLVNL